MIWTEVKRRGTWLTSADRFMIEVAVVLMDKHTRRVIDYKEIPHLIGVLSKLGFTPGERAKMNITDEQPDEAFVID